MIKQAGSASALAAMLAVAAFAAAPAPQRIVTFAPSLSETVFALGAGDRVVGVGDYAAFPPAVQALPRVGGLYNPNLERLTALRPDLVLIPSPIAKLQALGAARGIRVAVVPLDSLEDLQSGIPEIGALVGRTAAARALASSIRTELARVRARTAGLDKLPVLLVLDRPTAGPLRGIFSTGGGSFLDQLTSIAGGRNIFHDVGRRYFQASLEEILRRRPAVILELQAGGRAGPGLEAAAARAWSGLFGRGRTPPVHVLTDPIFVVPGPRVAAAAQRLAHLLHPELPPAPAP